MMRTQVAIIGAGPAAAAVAPARGRGRVGGARETRSREYVAARIRAGIMETSTVEVLAACGLDGRLREQGFEHRGIYLQWPEERHYLDFVLDV
jgi:p-hydroxybenzoate 3-monooxygenase